MKTRNGFVSNSSSSSFILIADKKLFYDTLEDYKDVKPIIEDLKKDKYVEDLCLFGKDVVVLSDWTDTGGGGPLAFYADDMAEQGKEMPDKLWDNFDSFKEKLQKDKDKCYSKSIDW